MKPASSTGLTWKHGSTCPAKFARPRVDGVLPRERLFAALDDRCRAPVVWVSGPPGCGKTTLVASYTEARGMPVLWYQVDSGDADAAAFFLYLRGAVQARWSGAAALPLLTAEYQADLCLFARRWFRACFPLLPAGCALVFDNFQDADPASPFQAAMLECLNELPDTLHAFVLSRDAPPAALARLRANRRIARLGWDELRLTLDETAGIASHDSGHDPSVIEALHRQCDGWAAGLVLLLEYGAADAAAGHECESREAVFDYFATEILDRVDAPTRALLLQTALLPRFSAAMAAQLGDNPRAADLLESLARRRYFIERRGEGAYQYHALFRAFLARRAAAEFSAGEYARLQRRAAALLEAHDPAQALALHLESSDCSSAIDLILRQAPGVMAHGRGRTLREWIEALPWHSVEAQPQLLYWLGTSLMPSDLMRARRHLEDAARRYAERGDRAGECVSLCAAIDTWFLEWADFSALDRHIARIEALLAQEPDFATAGEEVRVLSSLLIALLYRQPRQARLRDHADRLLPLLHGDGDINQRVKAGTYLLNYSSWSGDFALGRSVSALVQPLLSAADLSDLNRAWWLARVAYHHYIQAQHALALASLEAAMRIGDEHGFGVVRVICRLYRAFVELSAGRAQEAATLLAQLDAQIDPRRRLDTAVRHYLGAWLALIGDQRDAALEHAASAAHLADVAGVPGIRRYFLIAEACALSACGSHDAATARLREACALTQGGDYPLFDFQAALAEAHLALARGDAAGCRCALEQGLALGRRKGFVNTLLWLPRMMSGLAEFALAEGIESDYVAQLVRTRGLTPASGECALWPWPVRVRTLGRFELELDGKPLHGSGKSQRKPLELLQALVAFGGSAVDADTLAEALWPMAPGDSAHASLKAALHRLRQLLGDEQAVRLAGGKLSIDARRVWVDVREFRRLAADFEARLKADGEAPADALAQALFALYRGHFLQSEPEQPWMLGPRDLLEMRMLRLVALLGERCERRGAWREAIACYQRGLELDNLAESLYRRLMVCHQRCGEPAEAMNVYRRCREMLSIVLGAKPSAETEAVRQTIG